MEAAVHWGGRFAFRGSLSEPVTRRLLTITAATGIFALTVAVGVAIAGSLGFHPPEPHSTEGRPIDIAIGKIDGDAVKDIAVANRDGGSVSVLIGQDGGQFEGADNINLPAQPVSVAIAKLDGDGRADLVLGQRPDGDEPPGIAVLRGRANGFGEPKSYAVEDAATETTDVAVADLDRDGRSDVVVGQHQNGNDIYVLYGTKNGLAKPKSFPLKDGGAEGEWVQDVAVEDLDKDGVKDIVASAFHGGGVFVLWGKGSKSNPNRRYDDERFETGSGPTGLGVGKVNGDGRQDLVVASQDDDGTVSVLISKGKRGFEDFASYDAGGAAESVALGKFNDDSSIDIVAADFSGNQIEVLLGDVGGFAAPESFPLQPNVADVAASQLDGQDGDDVVSALWNNSLINVLRTDFE